MISFVLIIDGHNHTHSYNLTNQMLEESLTLQFFSWIFLTL